jgi:glycosyltransferase involved in cell wall biosynthesis
MGKSKIIGNSVDFKSAFNKPDDKKEKYTQNFDKSKLNEHKINIYIIIPAYNEKKTIKKVIEDLKNKNLHIIVVDDGSNDGTDKIVYKLLNNNNLDLILYKHIFNRGLGSSLKTGIEAALRKNPDIIVTFDADGQHDPEDLFRIVEPILANEADVVIGKRDFQKMILFKKIGNHIMNIITRIFYGVHVTDSQSGLRAFKSKAAELIDINSRGYGVSSEIIHEIKKNNLKLIEIPIKTIYTDYSLSKGTNTKIGLKILIKMIMDILK